MRGLIAICLFLISFICHGEAQVKAIIFDCDGVLVDSEGTKFRAWQEVLKRYGIAFPAEEYRAYSGHTGLYILSHVADKRRISLDPKIVDEKNVVLRRMQLEGVIPIQDALDVVHWAKEKKIPLAVASSASKGEILINLRFLKIADLFDTVLSGKEDLLAYHDPEGVNKPKPYIYLEAAKKLGLKPEECLVIEDSGPGVVAAKDAGCTVLAKPTSWTEEHDFSKADKVLKTSLLQAMQKHFNSVNSSNNR